MDIRPGDLDDPRILALLDVHLAGARAVSPPESTHALDHSGLKVPEISFFAAWEGETLLGLGALHVIAPGHGELKSMHTAAVARRTGVGKTMLAFLVDRARAEGLERLSLETGTQDYFAPARAMYAAQGFEPCAPYGKYRLDPSSAYMTMVL